MVIKPRTSRSTKAKASTEAFVAELSMLRLRTNAIVRLRRGAFAKHFEKLDKNLGESQAEVLALMNQIEASFRMIRRKLMS